MKVAIVVENRDYRYVLEKALQSLGHSVVSVDPAPQFPIKSIAASIVGPDPDLLFIDETIGPGRILGDVLYECDLALPPHHIRRWRVLNNPRVFRTTIVPYSLGCWSKYYFHQLYFLLNPSSSDAMMIVLKRRLGFAKEDLGI